MIRFFIHNASRNIIFVFSEIQHKLLYVKIIY